MGYMGFGMRKEAYSRAPRRHMAYLTPWLKAKRRANAQVGDSKGKPRSHHGSHAPSNQQDRHGFAKTVTSGIIGLGVACLAAYGLMKFMIWMLDPKHAHHLP